MSRKLSTAALAGALVCGLSGAAIADSSETAQLRAELAALRAEMNQIRQNQENPSLDQRRAEETRQLVREVLGDAQTRRSMLEGGVLAGIDEKGKIFLRSADDSFSLNIDGQIQFRYLYSNDGDQNFESVDGFQTRRAKLGFSGHIGNPRIGYTLVMAADRNGGDLKFEEVALNYKLSDDLTVVAGAGVKLPFLRETLMSSKRVLAVERGIATSYFDLARSEQIQLRYDQDRFQLAAAISDGSGAYDNPGRSDFAFTGRLDVLAFGQNWRQNRDVVAWEVDPHLFLGAAAHYEKGIEPGVDYFAYTFDALYKAGNIALMGAFTGGMNDIEGAEDRNPFAVMAQAGVNVSRELQPFVRWDYVDSDTSADATQAVTLGANYFLKGHSAKFTVDAVWVYTGEVNAGFSSGQGLRGLSGSGSGPFDQDQLALRAQFQLLF